VARAKTPAVREAALSALGRFDDPKMVPRVLGLWRYLDANLRQRALLLLVSRRAWALDLLKKVGYNEIISKSEMPDDIIRRARLFGDPAVNRLANDYFGSPKAASTADKKKRIDHVLRVLGEARPGNPLAGEKLFAAQCAACHTLFGRGGHIGPELTGYERSNVADMLLNIVDPSAGIREGFANYQIQTRDGRSLVGFMEERDASRIVLRDMAGQKTTIAAGDIVQETALPQSVMPEGLLEGFSDDQTRDFFSYLTAARDPLATAGAN
jgi:putative heme-binding domain-containing protein